MLAREERHRRRIEEDRLRPPSPPPIVHYSEHECGQLGEKLKGGTLNMLYFRNGDLFICWSVTHLSFPEACEEAATVCVPVGWMHRKAVCLFRFDVPCV